MAVRVVVVMATRAGEAIATKVAVVATAIKEDLITRAAEEDTATKVDRVGMGTKEAEVDVEADTANNNKVVVGATEDRDKEGMACKVVGKDTDNKGREATVNRAEVAAMVGDTSSSREDTEVKVVPIGLTE